MRKIISIVIALGLVLAFSAVAVPTVGGACGSTVTATVPPFCAGAGDEYNIVTASPVTLLPVNDSLSVEFGAGTTFGTFIAGDITVNGVNVDVTKVVKSGTKLTFPIPAAVGTLVPAAAITIVIDKVINPATPGAYQLQLNYKLSCCDAVVFDCADYTVVPATSTYDFHWDSSMTYNGIALDFVPPFKVCGQDTFPGSTIDPGKFGNFVNFILSPTVVGCAGPCATHVDLLLTVNGPAGGNCTIVFNGTKYYPVLGTPLAIGNATLGANTTLNYSAQVHFDSVADFQICLEAFCPPGSPSCDTGCDPEGYTVAEECWDISVYQHKDAVKIPLFRKWNLISLPLVPLEDPNLIEDVVAAHPDPDMILAIYYYDRCADAWSVWGNGQSSLDTLEDGKSYWVKVEYSHTDPLKAPGLPVAGLWVWGTPQPVPPNAPSAYPVCDGWNMVGLTGYTTLASILDSAYFWNLTYGQLYAWDGANQAWESELGDTLPENQVGEGYWIAVDGDGMIYPP